MADNYSLIFVNNSTMLGDACVYQTNPDTNDPSVMSLAWFSKRTQPTTRVRFDWTIDYSFIWSETGVLVPGVIFTASQEWPADLTYKNQVQFTKTGGAYTFQNQTSGPQGGTLYIKEDSTIPPQQASVGIGMSGAGTFAVQAQPNMTAMFTPHPRYWIAFGNFIPGQVLDIAHINNPGEIDFPYATYSMTAILNQDMTWTIKPTNEVNAAFIAKREKKADALWGEL
jgi:hypothetical protein